MHFCAGLPVILVGCKKDLRRDPRVIEELRKTSQRPVTAEEVRRLPSCRTTTTTVSFCFRQTSLLTLLFLFRRVWLSPRRLVPSIISSAQPSRAKVSVRFSSTPLALHCSPVQEGRTRTRASVSSSKAYTLVLPPKSTGFQREECAGRWALT